MRVNISHDWFGRFLDFDYKKLIVVVFLLRLISASAYDIFVTVTDKDILLPDSKFYSVRGRYVDLLLQGYTRWTFTYDVVPPDRIGRDIFIDVIHQEAGGLPSKLNEPAVYSYIVGAIYFVFGYHTIWVRVFNIILSMTSVYLLFRIAVVYFGEVPAKLFLVAALFLPTQFIYSITMCRDFLRMFLLSFVLWLAYCVGGVWIKRLRLR